MSEPLIFSFEPMHEILPRVRAALNGQGEAQLSVPNPDLDLQRFPGERTPQGIWRPLQAWLDLADRLECHLMTPVVRGERLELHLRRLPGASLHRRSKDQERYGADSEFQRLDKLEDPILLDDLLEALARVRLQPGARILDVGVNSGRELQLLDLAYPGHDFQVVGIDVSESALQLARTRFAHYSFRTLDVNNLPHAALGRFDLVLSLGTLQSSGIEQDRVFRTLLRDHLSPGGALILSLPNCRLEAGRLSYGARLLNFRRPDLSLLLKDLALYRRHLQKHGFRVYVTGKYEIVLTAVPQVGPTGDQPTLESAASGS
ncbi:class I SAM-dependent methyltransferase [Deinococcus peraridilitoris]|uniref:Methyltransferase family protein n=1 Tax=Deinococcus peraridilitoris (strain DSM 19664 / LMG 22246 / CIP 109416 / KR-200) TaxID=937777 RepID=L0A2N9_DEIPD|nr:class I SAM-dependent methyltransferase [Deinococcus peraridilitoris]AFZ68096.1 methyltransferase family protein [Deinococcus peraridilitoris DSM 19664]